jgi:UDP-N-acetylmuramyl tripeptide synthase
VAAGRTTERAPVVSTQQASGSLDRRLTAAIGVGKLAGLLSRRFRFGGGTALPGVLARRVDPLAFAKLARGLPRGVILVSGTNGKTTTSRLLSGMLQQAGWRPVHNRAGANLISGLTAALIDRSSLAGRVTADSGLFEVDEALLPAIVASAPPRVLVLTNLFRDQLDRFGEVDYLAGRWRTVLAPLPADATVVINADDPALAALGQVTRARLVYFGITATPAAGEASPRLDHFADTRDCPSCGAPLQYSAVWYAHLGDYRCPRCAFARPRLDLAVVVRRLVGVEGSDLTVSGPFGTRDWRTKLPGLYNAYNLLAAAAAASALDLPVAAIEAAAAAGSVVFGRLEKLAVGDRQVRFALIKNPVGLTEVLRTILAEPAAPDLALWINDNLADGTDVSWLWDADLELLAGRCRTITVGGTRAGDILVRLKYAGVPRERIFAAESLAGGFDDALVRTPRGGTLYVLHTYTAMLEARALVRRRGYAGAFWND